MTDVFEDGSGMSSHAEMAVRAEMAFLGAVLIGHYPASEMIAEIPVGAYWRQPHRLIHKALECLVSEGRDIDFLTMEFELGRRKQLADIGGPDYLMRCLDECASPGSWRTYADTVMEMAVRRSYAEKAKKIHNLVMSDCSTDELRAVYEEPVQFAQVGRAPIVAISEIELTDDDDDCGITTGFPSLDKMISTAGYPKGQMTVISAYHKGGKSTFMLSSYAHLAILDKRVLYATFADLNAVRLKRRLLRNLCGWSKYPPKDLSAQADFQSTKGDMELAWSAWMYDATKLDTGSDVETFCRWLESSHVKYRFDVVFVDYAQKMTSSDRKATNPVSEQDVCSTKLSRCFERLGICGVVGSQITEGNAERKAITKGSRKWEEDAGWVLRIEDESDDLKKIKIPYSRFGLQGKELIMGWNMDRLRFEDRTPK